MHCLNEQKMKLLFSVQDMLEVFEGGAALSDQNWYDMHDALLALNLPIENIMFSLIEDCRKEINSFPELKEYFGRFFDAHMNAAANSATISEDYKNGKYGSDREFMNYMDILSTNTSADIEAWVLDNLVKVRKTDQDYYNLITAGSRNWYFENNWLDGVDGINNSLINNRVTALKTNIGRLEWLYKNLSDAISRRSVNALIKYWLTWDYSDWRKIALYSNDVVDTSVYPFYDGEVFVDCGSYIGDTVVQYVNTVNRAYTRIYTYDISSASIEIIRENLSQLSNIVINHKGTGDTNTIMDMIGMDQAFPGNKLSAAPSVSQVEKVRVVRLDDDINEPITFLKVDCEGMDKETLRGACGIIRKFHPKLHVDSYHKLADVVDVPFLIHEIDPSYTLYMRLPAEIGAPPRFPTPAFMAV